MLRKSTVLLNNDVRATKLIQLYKAGHIGDQSILEENTIS